MYEIFKNVLNNRNYELVDILNKIDEFYVQDSLTKEQKDICIEQCRVFVKMNNKGKTEMRKSS